MMTFLYIILLYLVRFGLFCFKEAVYPQQIGFPVYRAKNLLLLTLLSFSNSFYGLKKVNTNFPDRILHCLFTLNAKKDLHRFFKFDFFISCATPLGIKAYGLQHLSFFNISTYKTSWFSKKQYFLELLLTIKGLSGMSDC